jgi:hypothetical protein
MKLFHNKIFSRLVILSANTLVCVGLFKITACRFNDNKLTPTQELIAVNFNLTQCVVDLSRFYLDNNELHSLSEDIKNGRPVRGNVVQAWYNYYGKSLSLEAIDKLIKASH